MANVMPSSHNTDSEVAHGLSERRRYADQNDALFSGEAADFSASTRSENRVGRSGGVSVGENQPVGQRFLRCVCSVSQWTVIAALYTSNRSSAPSGLPPALSELSAQAG